MLPQTITEFGYAKINLALHVTGQRADGYHLLDSLVVFAGIGDHLRATPAAEMSLSVSGPFADGVPTGEDNLVLRAARLVAGDMGVAFSLVKSLPPTSGIGGGSADAAAAIRAVTRLRAMAGSLKPLSPEDGQKIVALGADVPVCLASHPTRMRGIGEQLDWLPPARGACRAREPADRGADARRLQGAGAKENPPLPDQVPAWVDAADMAAWLVGTRNDLQGPALAVAPQIGRVLTELEQLPGR
ncbi:4-(cytidine 5'-diphospho)-2-C-methyl-D-erythritol kinase [Gemmobacter lanyuensis]